MIKGARDTSSKPKKEYTVEFESNAIRQLKKLDNSVKILIRKNPAKQDSSPAAGRKATSSIPPQCDPCGAFYQIGNEVSYLIKKWMDKHLVGTQNPRLQGKALVGDKSGYWRYRVGDYRIIVRIEDSKLLIIAISIAHRSEVYD